MAKTNKTVKEIIDDVIDDMCNNYCKYPNMPIPEGKDADWLVEGKDSPCQNCPLNRL